MRYPSTHDSYLETLTGENTPEPFCEKCGQKNAEYEGAYEVPLCEHCHAVWRANVDFENDTENQKDASTHPTYTETLESLRREYLGLDETFEAFREVFGSKH